MLRRMSKMLRRMSLTVAVLTAASGCLLSSVCSGDVIPTTGLQAWLKADSISASDGDWIGTWANSASTGATYNATQGTGTSKPVYHTDVINGKPALKFDGGDDIML